MRLRQKDALVRTGGVATALERIDSVVARTWQYCLFIVALDDAHPLTATGRVIQGTCILHLPGHPRNSEQPRPRQSSGKAAQRSAKAAAKVQEPRFRNTVQLQARENFCIHLLQHGFPAQRIYTCPVVAEVHIEFSAPRCVIWTGLAVVLFQTNWRYNVCRRDWLSCRFSDQLGLRGNHFSPYRFALARQSFRYVFPEAYLAP